MIRCNGRGPEGVLTTQECAHGSRRVSRRVEGLTGSESGQAIGSKDGVLLAPEERSPLDPSGEAAHSCTAMRKPTRGPSAFELNPAYGRLAVLWPDRERLSRIGPASIPLVSLSGEGAGLGAFSQPKPSASGGGDPSGGAKIERDVWRPPAPVSPCRRSRRQWEPIRIPATRVRCCPV